MNNFEIEILRAIGDIFHTPLLDGFMAFISTLGNGGFIWILISATLLCFKSTRHTGLCMSLSLILSLIICNITLKPLVERIRPFNFNTSLLPLIPPPGDFSFPSGHTFSSFAAATALFLSNKKAGTPALILALLIALSRLYLMVHYPSDVLFSIIFGSLAGIIAKKVAHYISARHIL